MQWLGDLQEDGKWALKPYTGDFMMERFTHFVLWLGRRGDPIGEWLGSKLLSPIVDPLFNRLFPTRESKDKALEEMRRDDPLAWLGISHEPPEIWKSLLWWVIFVVGM